VEVVTLIKTCEFLLPVARISHRLEQRINVKFCVKLGRNASDSCAMISEAYGGEAVESVDCFECHKRFSECLVSKLQMKTVLITLFDIKGIVHFECIAQGHTVN